MAFCNGILFTVDLMDTLGGFVVHLKWIRCTPEMDFVDTISLNILIKSHTETALLITLSTRKPALLRDSDSAINISTFCYSVLCTVDLMDTFNGFVVHLKWIRCTPEVDFVDTLLLHYRLKSNKGKLVRILLRTSFLIHFFKTGYITHLQRF